VQREEKGPVLMFGYGRSIICFHVRFLCQVVKERKKDKEHFNNPAFATFKINVGLNWHIDKKN
jgi:hypothetical protein